MGIPFNTRSFRRVSSAACTVVLSGCAASAPPFANPLSVKSPGEYVTVGTALGGPDRDWTKSFKDKKLEKLIAEVHENNFDLQAAVARVDQAAAAAKFERGDRIPTLETNFNGNRQQQAFIGFPFGGEGGMAQATDTPSKSRFNQFGVSLDLSWELDLWGRVRAGESALIAQTQAAGFDYESLRISLAGQTAKAWFALIEANQQLALAEESVESFEDSKEIIRDQFKLADQSGAQVRLSMADVENARATLAQREEELKAATRQLELLLGRYPSGELKAAKSLPSLAKPPPTGLPSELLYRRADLAAAERRLASSNREIKEAKLALLPSFSLTGSAGTATEDISNVLQIPDFGIWSIAGRATQTLLASGKTLAEISRRKAVVAESLADYQSTALAAFSEVENALTAEQTLRAREAALDKADELLEEAYDRAKQEYRDGVGDVLTILTAQRQLLTTRSQLLTVRRARLDNRVNLYLALGGDFDSRRNVDKAISS
ncbi:MAG: efflux transporter outer membrane subunit [Verrucomicrobiota bacterium]